MIKEVRSPVVMAPFMTFCPPNHSTDRLAAFMHSVIRGDMSTISFQADIPVFFRSALVASNRFIS